MGKPFWIILIISAVLTILAFWHDYLYDIPTIPYTTAQTITEMVFGIPLMTGVVFVIISAIYFSVNWIARKLNC